MNRVYKIRKFTLAEKYSNNTFINKINLIYLKFRQLNKIDMHTINAEFT